jgi:hypothetical protein
VVVPSGSSIPSKPGRLLLEPEVDRSKQAAPFAPIAPTLEQIEQKKATPLPGETVEEAQKLRRELGVKNERPVDRKIPIVSARLTRIVQTLPIAQSHRDSTLHLCDRALKSLTEMSAAEKRDALLSGLTNYSVRDPAMYIDRYPRGLLDDLDGLNVTEEMEDLLLLLVLDTALGANHRMLAVLLVRSQIMFHAAALLTSRMVKRDKNESAFG